MTLHCSDCQLCPDHRAERDATDGEHDHRWVFRDTALTDRYDGYSTEWRRIDFYYCSVCLEERTKTQATQSRETPDWWRAGVRK